MKTLELWPDTTASYNLRDIARVPGQNDWTTIDVKSGQNDPIILMEEVRQIVHDLLMSVYAKRTEGSAFSFNLGPRMEWTSSRSDQLLALDPLCGFYLMGNDPSSGAFNYEEVPPHLPAAYNTLNELALLGPNWDSYDAKPISPTALDLAHGLLHFIDERFDRWDKESVYPDMIAPVADGGVQFEWQTSKRYLSVRIRADGRFVYLLVTGTGNDRIFEERHDAPLAQVIDVMVSIINERSVV